MNSNHRTTVTPRPRGARPISFVYLDTPGTIDTFGFVLWGGAGFHLDAAPAAMLPAILAAMNKRILENEGGAS